VFNGEMEAYVVPMHVSDYVDCVTYTGLPHVVSDEGQGNKKNITGKVKASTDFQACVEYNEKKGNDPNEYLVSQSKANCDDIVRCIRENSHLERKERFKECRSQYPNCIQETPTFDKESGDITFTLKNVNLNDEDADRLKHNVRCNIENTDYQQPFIYQIEFTPKQSCTESNVV